MGANVGTEATATPKTRVDAWLAGRLPGYAPSWCPGVACNTAGEILGREVHTGTLSLHYAEAAAAMRGPAAYREFGRAVLEAQVELSRTLGWEFVGVPWRLFETPIEQIDDYTFAYQTGDRRYVRRYDPHAGTFGVVADSQTITVDDVPALSDAMVASWRDNPTVEGAEYFRQVADLIDLAGDEFEIIAWAGGFTIPLNEPWLMAIHLYPDAVQNYLDFRMERGLCEVRELAGLGVRFAEGGGDFADNTGPTYAPDIFRAWMIPRFKQVVALCNAHDMIYVFRSDGDLWPVLDDIMITAGCHAYGEIDDRAGMHIADLAERYPHRILFGNLPNGLLRTGSVDDVKAATAALLEHAARVRIVAGPSNVILHDTPAENVRAMQDVIIKHNQSILHGG